MKRVFLGGTCNNSKWRDKLIPLLVIDYFNPVVEDWDEEARKREIRERELCDFCLYVITPKMTGYYSIAEVVDDSIKRPGKTMFCYLLEDEDERFTDAQIKSLEAVTDMVDDNGGMIFRSLENIANHLNLYGDNNV